MPKQSEIIAPSAAHTLEEDIIFSFRLLPYRRSFLERFAVRFLQQRSNDPTPEAEDPVHILTPKERDEINRVVRRTLLRAFFAGLGGASITSLIDILFYNAPAAERYFYLISFGLLATLLEVSYLYWSHLNAVLSLTRATGAKLSPEDEEGGLADAMARAALELPDPTKVVEGIDPRRETSRVGLVLAVVLYKLKRGLTSFFFKFLIRRFATRQALKVFAPLIALPVSGLWNTLVSYRILREARMRVLGPSAVEEMIANILDHRPPLSEKGRVMLLRAVGVAMVRKRSAHPNLLALLRSLMKRTDTVRAKELDSTKRFLDGLPALGPEEQRLALIVLQLGAALDGSLSLREMDFIRRARRVCGLSPSLLAVETLLETFAQGDPIYPGMLEALARE